MSSLWVYAQASRVLSLPFPSESLCGGLSLVSTLGRLTEERDEEYEVDYIVASHIYRCQLQYLVYWKGYEDHEGTWEPASNIKKCSPSGRALLQRKPQCPSEASYGPVGL